MVRRVDDVADQRRLEEHGHNLEEIGEVAGPERGVVQDDRIARPEPLRLEVAQRVLDGERHGAEVTGAEIALGDQPGPAVEYAAGEIVALAHALGEGGMPDRRTDLFGDRQHGVPDHGKRDGVDGVGGAGGIWGHGLSFPLWAEC